MRRFTLTLYVPGFYNAKFRIDYSRVVLLKISTQSSQSFPNLILIVAFSVETILLRIQVFVSIFLYDVVSVQNTVLTVQYIADIGD